MTEFALGLAILAGASFPAAVDAEAPGATTGRAAVEKLVGNTLEEDDSASPGAHVIFLKQGGIARMREHGKGQPIMKQRWTISPDGLLCVSENRSPGNTDSECATVVIDGDRVEMSVADLDEPLTARLLPGNPYKL
ncbi:hypothetical protein [Novosphingobium lindaniclasticum]|uniref:Uncharacterized protein n=1 Tax=Novosphingobium lindaniclasticum LE124 TaxID=1096930 RepID=T0HFX1_9SPHN|nr:hypothetical protein [Novosphingobium lindaniclasticum]EQB15256.1 hypothetical protein L284_11515 [Novosphingobium lindaniclasticum LE124]